MDMLVDGDVNDVVFKNGQTPVTTDEKTKVAQRLKIKLQTFLGEYFLNTQAGVPYYQRVFGKVRNKSLVDTIFQRQILEDPDVLEILSYSSTLDVADRFLEVTFIVRTSEGPTGEVNIQVGV